MDHSDFVLLNGAIDTANGPLHLTLHVQPLAITPWIQVAGRLTFSPESDIRVNMNHHSIGAIGDLPLPIHISDVITSGSLVGLPVTSHVIDAALGDPNFTARLIDDLDGTVDLEFVDL